MLVEQRRRLDPARRLGAAGQRRHGPAHAAAGAGPRRRRRHGAVGRGRMGDGGTPRAALRRTFDDDARVLAACARAAVAFAAGRAGAAPDGAGRPRSPAEREGAEAGGGPAAPLLQSLLGVMALALDHAVLLQQAEALSVTDDLTGLYNSRYLSDALHREAKRAVRYGRPLSVLFVDLDGFKRVNDTPRPPVRQPDAGGGRRRHSRRARARPTWWRGTAATSSRWCCPTRASAGARGRGAARARPHWRRITFLAGAGPGRPPDGVGGRRDAARRDAASPEELLRAADEAMYRVKERGKNDIMPGHARVTPGRKE